MRRLTLILAVLAGASMSSGCNNKEAEKIRILERENKLLLDYKKNTEAADSIFINISNDVCKQSESNANGLIRRTNLACHWVNYVAGLQIHEEDQNNYGDYNAKLKMTENEVAQWSLVMTLSNEYANITHKNSVFKYGEARFKMMSASILDREFTKRVKPREAMKYIRNYMYMSQRDYGDVLARTAAGEKTVLTAEQETKKSSSNSSDGKDGPKNGSDITPAKQVKREPE